MKKNTLYYGDCLEVMKKWPDNAVDLIYLDPPFNSKVNYNILFGTGKVGESKSDLAQLTAFTDTWQWDEDAQRRVELIENALDHPAHNVITAFSTLYPSGSGMLSYLSYMAERLAEMHRLLKPSGSVYLHCDPTASHYLKITLDEIFGRDNFKNELIWKKYAGRKSNAKSKFPTQHDCIFFYVKGAEAYFNPLYLPMTEQEITKKYTYVDKDGRRYRLAWGRNYQTKGEQRRIYLDEQPGRMVGNLWTEDGLQLNTSSSERLGYPTQKPLALLDRIIKASSKEGDIVLDPFCGCGTTIEAAHNLKRDWIGIDISTYAIEVIRRERLNEMRIPIEGIPKDIRAAKLFAKNKPFDFEKWAVTRIPGFAPNTVQRGDGGVDGRACVYGLGPKQGLCIAQVKGGTPHVDQLRAFYGSIVSGKAAIGIFITLKKWDTPTVRQCIAEAGTLDLGATAYPRLVMYTIDDYFQRIDPKLPPLAHPRTGKPMHKELLDLQD